MKINKIVHCGSSEFYISEGGEEIDNSYVYCLNHIPDDLTNWAFTKNWEYVTCKRCLHKKENKLAKNNQQRKD